ncbi:MAG TPA: Ku protein [Acidimicrobiales bacterium]|nr:Ku protein [Acidimicrobiales bacterium]
MARAVWSGSISFGLVNVPVKAFTAQRDHSVHFHQLEKGSGARIRYQKVSEQSGQPVDPDDIELGYETGKGRYVTVERQEIDELRPESTRTIDVGDFVALDEIDPVYYERTYWLAPDGQAAERAYLLLLAAMEDRRRVGIGTVVMRDKQYLAAIRPLDGALAMSTMRFADEVVARDSIEDIPAGAGSPPAKELRLAAQIVDSLATDWEPERYHDTYTEQLRDIIARRQPQEAVEATAPEPAEVVDLMAALEKSLAAARGADAGKGKGSAGRKRASSTKGRSRRSA